MLARNYPKFTVVGTGKTGAAFVGFLTATEMAIAAAKEREEKARKELQHQKQITAVCPVYQRRIVSMEVSYPKQQKRRVRQQVWYDDEDVYDFFGLFQIGLRRGYEH
jgi:hypothetical protein